jgi:hypothetical protein
MAEVKTTQREYVIPLRRECLKVPYYERTARAIKAIKKFIVIITYGLEEGRNLLQELKSGP